MTDLQVKAFRSVLKDLLNRHLLVVTELYLDENTKEDLEVVLAELGISSEYLDKY